MLNMVAAWSWLVYIIIFLILLVESIGLPIPGLTIVLAAAALSGQGRLEFWLVFLASVAGGTLGSLIGYYIGKNGGRRLLERYGRYVFITPERLASGEALMQKHGLKGVLLGRYLPVLCFLAGALSGMARLPYRAFFICNFLSIVLWSGTQLSLAYIFGRHLETLINILNNVSMALIVAVVVVGGGLYLRQRIRRAGKRMAESIAVRQQPEI